MAKLTRITGKVFGETASPTDDPILGPEIGQFGSAVAGTYYGTSDVATIQNLAAWSSGFIGAVTPSNQYPPLPEMTGFGKVVTHQTSYLLQEGVPEYDENTVYYTNSICKGVNTDDKLVFYRSIADENQGNPLTDETNWEELSFGGGSSGTTRFIGEIVTSLIPLTDAGLHLLDGSLLQYGVYKEFIDYIAELYNSGNYSNLFATEAAWQSSNSTYGACGKFVYNATNKTVRLPRVIKFLEGTLNTNEIATLMQAGLPNITGRIGNTDLTADGSTGCFYRSGESGKMENTSGAKDPNVYIDASRSSSVYGKSNTVQPQSIKVLYYIAITTTYKTPIQVDIDEIITDLNAKADSDLSNIAPSTSSKTMISSWSKPNYSNEIRINSLPYTLPADGYISFGLYKPTAGTHSIYRNGSIIGSQYNSNASFYTSFTGEYFFYKGDVISADSAWIISSLFFYPMNETN